MNQALNHTQRKLVEDNHNLIYSFLNSRNLSLNSVEDWYGTAAIGLCKAASVFDENRGSKFTTLAYICMDNEVKQIMRKNRKDVPVTNSINEDISNTDGCSLSEIIPDPRDCFYSVYLNDAITIATSKMSDRHKSVLKMLVEDGLSQKAISQKLNISQGHISRIYNSFLKNIREYLSDYGHFIF